eukprot:1195406-Prorocentrum_minimum.AAC.2
MPHGAAPRRGRGEVRGGESTHGGGGGHQRLRHAQRVARAGLQAPAGARATVPIDCVTVGLLRAPAGTRLYPFVCVTVGLWDCVIVTVSSCARCSTCGTGQTTSASWRAAAGAMLNVWHWPDYERQLARASCTCLCDCVTA